MRFLWTALAIALLAGGSIFLTARADDAPKKKITIGLVAKSQSNPVFLAAKVGAEDAAKELGPKYNAEITIDWETPPTEDAQKQADAVEQLGRSGAQGIAVSCSDGNTLTPAINKAVDAGAVVVTFDSDAPKSKRLCCYGTDDVSCGKLVMQQLAKAMGDKGTIAILAGNQAAPNLRNRVKGVTDELANHPNMKLLDDGIIYHGETAEQAAEKVQAVQSANPSIQGWAMIGGWPLFAKDSLKWDPGTVKCVAVDALPAELGYLRDGHVQVLLGQDCYGWGHKSVEILLEKIVNGKDPEGAPHILAPLTIVTKENADEYGKSWDKWLGKN